MIYILYSNIFGSIIDEAIKQFYSPRKLCLAATEYSSLSPIFKQELILPWLLKLVFRVAVGAVLKIFNLNRIYLS